nr:MAG TPA: hypothetical protein [Caudoviricetes sp.]
MKLTRSLRSLRQFHLISLHQKIFFIKVTTSYLRE